MFVWFPEHSHIWITLPLFTEPLRTSKQLLECFAHLITATLVSAEGVTIMPAMTDVAGAWLGVVICVEVVLCAEVVVCVVVVLLRVLLVRVDVIVAQSTF
jgi:hypothetical protein